MLCGSWWFCMTALPPLFLLIPSPPYVASPPQLFLSAPSHAVHTRPKEAHFKFWYQHAATGWSCFALTADAVRCPVTLFLSHPAVSHPTLDSTALHRPALPLYSTALHRLAVPCFAVQCSAVQCSALHRTTPALHCTASTAPHCTALHRTALHLTALQVRRVGTFDENVYPVYYEDQAPSAHSDLEGVCLA